MRALIQRVSNASLKVDDKLISSISQGLVVYIGIGKDDDKKDIDYLVNKLTQLRIFNDKEGRMNLSVQDINGELLVVSQFTLHAKTKKGNRPSYIHAADPKKATLYYQTLLKDLAEKSKLNVCSGVFGAHMIIDQNNDGPVSIWIDTKSKE